MEQIAQHVDKIELEDINEYTILKVIDFLEHFDAGNELPKIDSPLKSVNIRDLTPEWYANFITELSIDFL